MEKNRDMKTEIIYEDNAVIVARKPAGLAVQTSSGFRADMVSELKNHVSRRTGEKDPFLGLVHRLDQPVEGLLVFGVTRQAAADLSGQLTDGRLYKKYLAVLTGIPAQTQGVRIDYLKKDRRTNLSAVVSEKEKDGKRAELSYRILAERPPCSLAQIEIRTGRHHQIRVQMAHMGYPLLGDVKYGSGSMAGQYAAPALCASYLEFDHPVTGERQQFAVKPEHPAFHDFPGETLVMSAFHEK